MGSGFVTELADKEAAFCHLLGLDHGGYTSCISGVQERMGLMTLFDFYKTKLKIFKESPRHFARLEWGIKYHFMGTARAALAFSRHLDLTDREAHSITVSAFFHDIAKIKYDNDFFIRKLHRPDQRIPHHPVESFQLVVTYCGYFDAPILFGVLQHHEYFAGNGYPLGLKGDQIHWFSRLITVVDAYSAMMETREFSAKKETVRDVLEEIEACRSTQFDPDFADAFIKSNPGSICRKG
ncbi:MAG: HD domain-containing phosphohydrolase [Planctomycetota bacterium]